MESCTFHYVMHIINIQLYTMMKNERILAMIVLLAIGSCTLMAQTLVIWQKDGSKVYYNLDESPKTTFTPEELVMTTSTAVIKYPLANILRYTYETEATNIGEMKSPNIGIKQNGDELIVVGLPLGKSITVFSADGKQLMSKRSDGSNRLTLSLSGLPAGVYVIKAENMTYKLMKL